MSKLFWRAIKSVPAIAVGSLLVANASLAQAKPEVNAEVNPVDQSLQQIDQYQTSGSNSLSQVTNVNQLRDVSPADWAYEALRSLVDRYGCIAGFPNQTYRGNQALSRYEFAAGLNSCLNQIERLVASSEAVVREDIDTISRLTQEFEAELATLSGRVDDIESRTAFLEDNQFSTTTKLKGEVIFAIADTFGDGATDDSDPTQTTFSDRVRLNFDSSFYGKDRLRVRLEAANVPRFDGADATGFNSTRLGFDANNGNNIEINDLYYQFPFLDDRFTGYVGAVGLDLNNILNVNNPALASSGSGALSRFIRRNPILFRSSADGAGAGLSTDIGPAKVTGFYLSNDGDASNPADGEGIFNGSFTTGAQIELSPNDDFDVALTYAYDFLTGDDVNLTGDTGSAIAADPFGGVDTRAHQFGLGANYTLGDKLVLSATGGLSLASEVSGDNDATLYTAAVTASLLDIGKEGAVFSVAGGVPPSLTDNDAGADDEDTTFLIEAQYKYPVNDNISITPGAFVVLNPDGNSDNDTQVVGVLRTTFKF